MYLVGKKVKIEVNEPYEWAYGDLTGSIVKAEAEKLVIKLSKKIQGSTLLSDLIVVHLRYVGDNFYPAKHKRTITINGALICESSDKSDFVLIGTIMLS